MQKKIKVVTQNCFWSRRIDDICLLMDESTADIYCFQEITTQQIADELKKHSGLNYLISRRFKVFFSYFHNVIFTNLSVLDWGEIEYRKPKKNIMVPIYGKVLWAELIFNGQKVRVYNCHLMVVGQGMLERKTILLDIIRHSSKFDGPVIICGDMNTSVPGIKYQRKLAQFWLRFSIPDEKEIGDYTNKNEKYLFYDTAVSRGFREITDLAKNTWRMPLINKELFNLKLDWMLYKGFTKKAYRLGEYIGDHRAIIGEYTV